MKKIILLATICILGSTTTAHAETVTYQDGDTTLEGYWVPSACENAESAPVVMIAHQWMGLTDYEKMRADMLSKECYNAFAIDVYGQGVRAADTEEAAKLATQYKSAPTLARRRVGAALDYVYGRSENAAVAIIGYCFGGTMALELARSGAPIDAAVSFHGGLGSQEPVMEAGVIQSALQIHHGAVDPLVPKEEVSAFKNEMNAAHVDWMFIVYADAVHAFTQKDAGNDPSTGVAYNEKADQRSWSATLNFLDETLR